MYKHDDLTDRVLRIICSSLGAFLLFVITGKSWLWLFGIEYAHLHEDIFIFLGFASIFIGWIIGYEGMRYWERKNAKELQELEDLFRKQK